MCRQEYSPVYFPYGVGYLTKIPTLDKEKTIYPVRTTHYEIKRHQSFEIDDLYDFLAIESIVKYQAKQ